MTVANIITLGCGEYEDFIFVLFPHLTTVMQVKISPDRKVLMI